jgi:hypothetical protein
MSTQSIIPSHYDLDWILEQMRLRGVVNHYGHGESNGDTILVYRAQDFDIVQSILDDYPTQYADEVLRGRMLDDLAATRWKQQQGFTLNGAPMKADPETIGSITAAVVLMDTNPDSPRTRRWKSGPRLEDWVTVDRNTLVFMGGAIASHIQACFDREEELALEIIEAADVFELQDIDIKSGWPA